MGSLGLIGNMIGKVVKIDQSMSINEKGGFARICVDIDLQSPLLLAFKIFDEERQLVYEGLHLLCFGCGRYGHERMVCPDSVGSDEAPCIAASLNEKDDQMNQTLVDSDKSTIVQGMTMAGAHRSGVGSHSGRELGSSKDKHAECL